MSTVNTIIEDAVTDGLGLPRDNISNDVISEAVRRYAKVGRDIFDAWPWDNNKIDQFDTDNTTYVTSYTGGIITFTALVDIVRAIQPYDSAGSQALAIWPQNEVTAAIRGEQNGVGTQMFQHLADLGGFKRVKVATQDNTSKYAILAFKRFVEATVESTYDSATPSATPTDYRVLEWPIRQGENALISRLADELRKWDGQDPINEWPALLGTAIAKIELQEPRDHASYPIEPSFGDTDDWQFTSRWGTAQ